MLQQRRYVLQACPVLESKRNARIWVVGSDAQHAAEPRVVPGGTFGGVGDVRECQMARLLVACVVCLLQPSESEGHGPPSPLHCILLCNLVQLRVRVEGGVLDVVLRRILNVSVALAGVSKDDAARRHACRGGGVRAVGEEEGDLGGGFLTGGHELVGRVWAVGRLAGSR